MIKDNKNYNLATNGLHKYLQCINGSDGKILFQTLNKKKPHYSTSNYSVKYISETDLSDNYF